MSEIEHVTNDEQGAEIEQQIENLLAQIEINP